MANGRPQVLVMRCAVDANEDTVVEGDPLGVLGVAVEAFLVRRVILQQLLKRFLGSSYFHHTLLINNYSKLENLLELK